MTDTASSLVLKVDSTDVERGAKSLDELAENGVKAQASTDALSKATDVLAGVVRGAAAAFGVYKLAQYAQESALLAARYETLGVSMVMVGRNAGYTASQMDDAAKAMQQGGISMIESRQQAMRLVQAHIDLSDSSKLARIAQDAAVIGNINSSEAFARLVNGIQTGQTEILRGIGLNVSMEQSYKKMAESLGVNTNALTQNQKTQAVLNAVMEQGAAIAGTYEAAMGTAGKQLNSMARYQEDLKVKIGETFNEVLTVAVIAFTEHLKDSNNEVSELSKNKDLEEWGHSLASVFVGVLNTVNNLVVGVKMLATYAGHSSAQSDIRSTYDSQMAATGDFDMTKRAAITAARDKALKDEQTQYEAAQVELAGSHDKFERAWEERTAARVKHDADAAAATQLSAKQVSDGMVFYTESLKKGEITEKQYTATVIALRQAAFGDNHDYDKGTKAVNTHTEAVDKAVTKAAAFIAALQKEAEEFGRSKDQQKAYEAGVIALTLHKGKERDAFLATTKSLTDGIKARQAAIDAEKMGLDQTDAYIALLNQREMAESDATASIENSINAINENTLSLTLNKEQLQQHQIALVMEKSKLDATSDAYAKLKQRMEDAYAANNAAQAAKAANDEWKSMWSTVEQTGKSVFFKLVGEGEKTWKSIGKALKSSVIDLLYQMTAKKWFINIGASMSGGGVSSMAQAAGGGSDMLSMGSNAYSLYGVAGNVANYGLAAGTIGAASYGTLGVGAAQASALSAQTLAFGAEGYSATAAALGTTGTTLGSAGATVGGAAEGAMAAMGPVGWIALAAMAAWAIWGNAGGGPKTEGNAYGTIGLDGTLGIQRTGAAGTAPYGDGNWNRPGADAAHVEGLLTPLGTAIGAYITKLGGNATGLGIGLGYNSDPAGTAHDNVMATVRDSSGADVYRHVYNVDQGKGGEAMQKETSLLMIAAVQATDGLPDIISAIAGSVNLLAAGAEQSDQAIAAFQAQADATLTWINDAAIAIAYTKADPVADWAKAAADASATLQDKWQSSTASLNTLLAAYDGSAASTKTLAAATQNQYQLELQLIGQIQSALASTQGMFGNSIESIKLSVMDESGKYDYYRTQADTLYQQLQTASDPAQIQRLAEQINTYTNQAYGLLDTTQQQGASGEFISYLTEVDELTAQRLNESQDQITQSHTDMAAAITTAMDAAAEKMAATIAAAVILAAQNVQPNPPVQVNIDYLNAISTETGIG